MMRELAFAVSTRPFPLVTTRTCYHQTPLCTTAPHQTAAKAVSRHAPTANVSTFAPAHLLAAATATAIVTFSALLPAKYVCTT